MHKDGIKIEHTCSSILSIKAFIFTENNLNQKTLHQNSVDDSERTKQDLSIRQPAAKNAIESINQSTENTKTLKECQCNTKVPRDDDS